MNILAIKGGGVRGIIVTRFLIEIEEITKTPIAELFDYIGGSSVGTLIACGILMAEDNKPKYTAKQIHEIFINDVINAFSWTYKTWCTSLFGLIGPSYTNLGLLDICGKLCGDHKLECLLKPVIFPVYDKIRQKAYYFSKEKNGDLLLKDIIMSCTAAPIYFPSNKIEIDGEKYDLIDGGIVVNNTAELVFLKATSNMTQIDKSKILELNIGTGIFTDTNSDNQGLISWLPLMINTLMNASNDNELFELSLSLPQENYCIFDIELDIQYYKIDDNTKKSIDYYLEKTNTWIEENKVKIRLFCEKLMLNKGLEMDKSGFLHDESADELVI